MFRVNEDLSIYLTRGDICVFSVTVDKGGATYQFKEGDIVRIKVFGRRDVESVALQKDFVASPGEEKVVITLNGEETKFGEYINKPTAYWYEIELNPETAPQTIIGYDENGEKILMLFPEGGDGV